MRGRVIAVGVVTGLLIPAGAAVPVPVGPSVYQVQISGTVSEFNSLAGGFQVTGQVDLTAGLLVEPRLAAPSPSTRVVALLSSQISPLSDNRHGAIHFATNTQAYRLVPNLSPTLGLAALDVAQVSADPVARRLVVVVDGPAARTTTANTFRTNTTLASTPAQILAGGMTLTFSPDLRTVTGTMDLGGNGLIEPGNPLFPVRRYAATIAGTLTGTAPGSPPSAPGTPGTPIAPPTPPPAPPPTAAPARARVSATIARRILPGRVLIVVRGNAGAARGRARLIIERRVGRRFVTVCAARVRSSGRFVRGCRVDGLARRRAAVLRLRVRLVGPGSLGVATSAVVVRRIPRTPAR